MNLLASLNMQFGKLVHPALQAKPHAFLTHRNFLATRLAVSLGALVAAPLCLALGGAPAWWQTGALAWLLLPIAAVAYVSRTGNLARGEALSLAAWIGLAVTLSVGSGSATGLGLLLLVPLEVASSSLALSTGILAAIGLAGIASIAAPLIPTFGSVRPPQSLIVGFGAGLTAAACLYGLVLMMLASRLQQRRQADERQAKDRYHDLADMIDEVPFRLDRSGMVIHAGSASQRLFGIADRDLLGRGLFEHVHVADRPIFLKLVADAADGIARGTSVPVEVRLRTGLTLESDKGPFREPVFAWVGLRVRLSAGNGTPSLLCLIGDVTERKRRDEALSSAEDASRRSDAGRTLFLANVSHELRTPLNAIIGFADMLSSEAYGPRDPAKQREYATIIQQSGHHLLAVVNSILDASKIEAGSFSIVPEPFDLAGLVHSCCDMVGLKANVGGVELVRDIARTVPEVVGDERAYRQVLLNLLSNAIKFTPHGGLVTISARPEGTSIILAVADNGVGVSIGDLPKLGAPFFQAQSSYDRAFDGTGLGLSVVRGLVALHGGSMVIESALGQGTRVAVRMPADCRSHARPPIDTKIETIPRYVSPSRPGSVSSDFARSHKIA